MTNTPPNAPNAPTSKTADRDLLLGGVQFWLFFLITFSLLGYPLPLAIILAAVGGLAGGSIVARWQMDPKTKDVNHNDADHLVQGLDVESLYQSIRNQRERRFSDGRKRRQAISVQEWFKLRR